MTKKVSKKTVAILGSTGSVGVNTLHVMREYAAFFEIVGLAAGKNSELLEAQAREFSPGAVYLQNEEDAEKLSKTLSRKIRVFCGNDGLEALTEFTDADILVVATSGTRSLKAVLCSLKNGKRVALVNKEILVVAGNLVMAALRKNPKACLIPVDSEHNAIFQCLEGHAKENVEKIILTGSGGPLRELSPDKLKAISKEVVVNHPKWKMGKKISVDSATLMNKGLEIIEASWLFDMPLTKIEVLIHPEAVVHSMVQFKDGSVIAQLGVTDMRLPIQHALGYPGRFQSPKSRWLDFTKLPPLTFMAPNREKFPCLDLAYEAAKKSGNTPCVLSAADEVAVHAFLDDRIPFLEIPKVIEEVLSRHEWVPSPSLSQLETTHRWAVEETSKLCQVR